MRYTCITLCTLVVMLLLPLCAGAEFRTVNPGEAQKLLETRGDIMLLDVRTPEEHEQGTIPGSTLVSVWDIAYNRVQLPKNRPLMLFCATGARSFLAGQLLDKRGYPEVYNLSGGIADWYRQGLPVVIENSSNGAPIK